jgi:hypothetical protein
MKKRESKSSQKSIDSIFKAVVKTKPVSKTAEKFEETKEPIVVDSSMQIWAWNVNGIRSVLKSG